MNETDLISDEMREMNEYMHKTDITYGGGSRKAYAHVMNLIKKYECESVLDYGCGKAKLKDKIRAAECWVKWRNYDPAIEEYKTLPEPADLIIVRDVMEHVEPEKLDNVFAHIASLSTGIVWFLIPRNKSTKTLSDGRNAHLTQKTGEWWAVRVEKHFVVIDEIKRGKDFNYICKPKGEE